MLTLLIGSDWISNRDEILTRISADVHSQMGGRVLIVPELISHDAERRLCKAAGDTCSRFAEVLSFSRLVKRVSEYICKPVKPCLDQGGRIVAMANATRQVHSKLKAYASVETKPEFFSGLVDAVDEFKRCCISPADLMEASLNTTGSLAQKLEELSLLLESYESVCAHGKCDPRDLMSWLLDELEVTDYAQNHVFYIDGFPDFTRQNLNVIEHLVQHSSNVTISLTCDSVGSDKMAYSKAGETAEQLVKLAAKHGVETKIVKIEPRKCPVERVGNLLFDGNISGSACDSLHALRAKSVYQECEIALEVVLGYVTNGARYRDINIVCSDMGAYRNVLEMLFEKSGIPLYISGTDDILTEPAINTLFAALEVVVEGFELQSVLQYLKSMLSPLDTETADLVENYAVQWGINGKSWAQEWKNHPDGLDGEWSDQSIERIDLLNKARVAIVEPLVCLSQELQRAANLGDMVRSLYDFLRTIQYDKRLSKYADDFSTAGLGRESQVLNQLWDIVIAALEQLYDTIGQTIWDKDGFLRLLKILVSQYNVGTIPPVLDAVSAGSPGVMRCQQCKYLIVLGVSEGVMPGYTGSTGILTDHERNTLRQIGIPLTGGAMDGLAAEFADIYGVFTSADSEITVCCSDGEPSFIFKRLAALAGGEKAAGGLLGPAVANKTDAAAYFMRHSAEYAAEQLGISADYQLLTKAKNHELGGISSDSVRKLYGSQLSLSASRVDKQALCRLAYFLQYGLYAKERKPIEVDPAEFGTYVHAVLEDTVRIVMDRGGFHQITAEKTVQIAKFCADAYAKERFAALDTDRVIYLFRRNWAELESIVIELWEEMQNSAFTPVGLEVAFGDGEDIAAIDVSGDKMPARLRGFVDRVDAWYNGTNAYYRVVDYKTGRKSFDYCDIVNGYGMQMLLYLFALQDSGEAVVGENAIPAGVQYFPARVPLIKTDGALSEEEAKLTRVSEWKRKGLLLSDEAVLTAMENTDTPVRMPISRKKDGTISGNIADYGQFLNLRKFVFRRVGKIVDEIASGNVSPNPYTRGTSFNACTFCPYGMICHKASVKERRNYRAISDKEFWSEVEKEVNLDGRGVD